MSDKRYKNGNSIILNEKDAIVNDPAQVAEIFNDFFTTVASGIGFDDTIISAADAIHKHKEHPSVEKIRRELMRLMANSTSDLLLWIWLCRTSRI